MLPKPKPKPEPAKCGYVICSEHRTGSTLLCQWLDATGMLGHPAEYFARTEDSIAIDRDPSKLAGVLAKATTPNGVYGIKLFSQQFDVTMKADWVRRLPEPYFVYLERRDLLGQAISLVRALQTQQYRSHEDPQASARYDGKAIHLHLRRLAEANARWRLYFARNGIAVLWLVYEDMILDPTPVVSAVATHIGIAAPSGIDPRSVEVAIQRDGVSEAWRARFIADYGDRSHLDHPLGKPRILARRIARDVGCLVRGWSRD